MINLLPLLGAVTGFFIAGWTGMFLGAMAGFFLARMIAGAPPLDETSGGRRMNPASGRFNVAKTIALLSAAVMKADGKVLKSELNFVKTVLNHQFGATYTSQLLPHIKEGVDRGVNLRSVCEPLRVLAPEADKLQILHFLFQLAKADGHVSKSEAQVIQQISVLMGVADTEFKSIQAMFFKDSDSSYKVLGLTPSANDEDVKKAYRSMAKKYHPDKLSHLGDEHQKAAQEKFRMVQEAYENIQKERGH